MKKDNKKLLDIIREIKPLEICNKPDIEYIYDKRNMQYRAGY